MFFTHYHPRRAKQVETKDFTAKEKYTPLIPHQQSKDELLKYAEQDHTEGDRSVSVVPVVNYQVAQFRNAEIDAGLTLTSSELDSKDGREIIQRIIGEIVRIEAPIAMNRLIAKTLHAVRIGRSSPGMADSIEKLVKKSEFKVIRQNGETFVWLPEQQPETYAYYRVDSNNSDKRTMDEISQQELKNAVCIALQNKEVLGKYALIKEAVSVMGYSRSGAKIVDAIERGLKYGRKTGEIAQDGEAVYLVRRG